MAHFYKNGRRLTAENFPDIWPRTKAGTLSKRVGPAAMIEMGGVRGVTDILDAVGGEKLHGLMHWSGALAIQAAVETLEGITARVDSGMSSFAEAATARWKELQTVARDRGTEFHDGIERWERGETPEDPIIRAACENIQGWLDAEGLADGRREYCFTATVGVMSFGGTTDHVHDGKQVILDYKTVEKSRAPRFSECSQIAAYHTGIFGLDACMKGANLYIRQEDGGIDSVRWWTDVELLTGWELFQVAYNTTSLLDRWAASQKAKA